ncbi:MAG: hypothetical protein WC693_04125 [Patescibacteria group bacterium]|jgi:hypothetical protein
MAYREGGYTGKLIEHEMLGVAHLESAARARIEYQPYQQALKSAKERQPGNPSDPKARFANDLHATICELMGLEDYNQLRFYTSVGSSLDHFHGIDGFFELSIDENNPADSIVVTVDITMNPNKGDQYKADHIITVPTDGLDPKEDKEAFAALVKSTAEQITKIFESQMAAVA